MESPVFCKSLLLVRIRAEESLLLQLKNNLRFKSNATGNMKLVTIFNCFKIVIQYVFIIYIYTYITISSAYMLFITID